MRLTFEKERTIKRAVFALLVLLTALFQHTKGAFPTIGGAAAWLMVPLLSAIALQESSVAAMAFGVFGGLLWDVASPAADGYFAIMFCILTFVSSTLASFLLQRNLPTCLLVTGVWLCLFALTHWLFFVVLRGYDAAGMLLLRRYLPSMLYTFCLTPLYYFLVAAVSAPAKRKSVRRV